MKANWYCTQSGQSWPHRYSQGDSPYPPHPGRRPAAENIESRREVLMGNEDASKTC